MTLAQLLGLLGSLFFLGQALTAMLVYVWSRRSPGVRVNFFGLLTFQAPFLPWALMGFSMLLGNSILVDLLGEPAVQGACPKLGVLGQSPGPLPAPTPLPHSWRPHPSSPSNKSAYRFYLFEPDPFADACVGPDPVGMGGSGCLLTAPLLLTSSGLTSSQVLPTLGQAWPHAGLAGRAGHQTPMLWGLQGCGGWPRHWRLSHRDCGGPRLLLPGGRLPQPAWRQEAAADPQLPVSADSLPHPLPQMALYPMRGGTLPAAAQRGLLPTGNCYWMPQRRTPITCPSPRSSQDPCSSEDDLTQSRVPHPHPWPATQLPVLEAGPGPRAPALNKQVTCSLFATALAPLPRPASPRGAGAAGREPGPPSLTCSPTQNIGTAGGPERVQNLPTRQQNSEHRGQPCWGSHPCPACAVIQLPLMGLTSQGRGWDWDAGLC